MTERTNHIAKAILGVVGSPDPSMSDMAVQRLMEKAAQAALDAAEDWEQNQQWVVPGHLLTIPFLESQPHVKFVTNRLIHAVQQKSPDWDTIAQVRADILKGVFGYGFNCGPMCVRHIASTLLRKI